MRAVVWLLAAGLYAQDAGLTKLRDTLVELRKQREEYSTRGKPLLDVAKRQLREWIESRLPGLNWKEGDAILFAQRLNTEIDQAKLRCDDASCDEANYLGFVGRIRVEFRSGGLLIITGLGIVCGYDESAYLYEYTRGDSRQWRRYWQSEQPASNDQEYTPQNFDGVFTSRVYGGIKHRLVLTIGHNPWCSSAWHPVYYRLWRIDPGTSASFLMVDGRRDAYLNYQLGQAYSTGAVIEFSVGSIDTGVHSRPVVLKYAVDGKTAKRIDPVALNPRDFVDEWLQSSWPESSAWSAPGAQSRLHQWHQLLTAPRFIYGEFLYPTRHCMEMPDLWQVGVELPQPTYFLVRWRPPYTFRMVDISVHPRPECNEEDREADEPRTLFAGQERP